MSPKFHNIFNATSTLSVQAFPTSPNHAGLNRRVNLIYWGLARDRWLVACRSPLRLDDFSEPELDFMPLKPSPDDYTHRHPGPEEVFLLVEVADSTLDYDREE